MTVGDGCARGEVVACRGSGLENADVGHAAIVPPALSHGNVGVRRLAVRITELV
jgi:hypothetical protein